MSARESSDDRMAPEANRLYWDSDVSVNQIADRLGISKGRLYEVIRPLPSGLPCPRCGEEMVFPNRTAREKGFLTCSACGLEEEESEVRSAWSESAGRTGGGALVVPPEAMKRARREPSSERTTRIVAGTALLGIAAGIAVATWLGRR